MNNLFFYNPNPPSLTTIVLFIVGIGICAILGRFLDKHRETAKGIFTLFIILFIVWGLIFKF